MARVNPQYQQPSWQAQGQPPYNQPGTAYGQHPGYQGVYQERGPLQPGRPPIQSGPQTCYNCGSPDHWAQHCPEPRRAVPAGSFNRSSNPRPNKRHKVNGPIVTRYPVPPHLAMHQAPPHPYRGTSYSKPGFYHQHPHYGPPTPVSAYAVPDHQWPQTQQQHYNTAYPQGYHYPQYGPQNPPTPAASYGPQYPSPVSARGHLPNNGFPQQIGPYQEHGSPQRVRYGGPVNQPYPPSPSFNQQWPQQPPQNVADGIHRVSNDPNEGLQPTSVKSGNTSEIPVELDSNDILEDALDGLDIPDIPVSREEARDWHPPRLVLRPLASDYFAEEVIATLPPPLKADGRSISKYFAASNCQESLQSIRETSDWSSIKDDPAFQRIADDGPSIPADHLRARRTWSSHDELRNDLETEEPESPGELDAVDSQGDRKDDRGWSVMDNLEQALNSRDVFAATKQSHLATVKSNNVASAAAGSSVNDGAWIVSPRSHPPPKSTSESHNKSLGRTASSGSGSPDSFDDYNHSAARHRDMLNYPTAADGIQRRGSSPSQHGYPDDRHRILSKRRRSHPSSSDDYERPTRKPSSTEQNGNSPISRREKAVTQGRPNVSPPSSDSSRDQHHAVQGRNSTHKKHGRHGSNTRVTSPPIIRSEKSNPRKREFDSRESLEDPERERRRQADDVTPKLKRRQPKVAEAYSRRW